MSGIFTNDPINWIKWAVVFVVFIGAFIASIKIIKKTGYDLKSKNKVNKIREKGHVFTYLFLVFMPFVLAALTAMALHIPFNGEQIPATGSAYEGNLIHNGITVQFKTPKRGTGGGEYGWRTYYIDEETKTDVRIEFGFLEELPQVPEGSRREDCKLWGKEMICDIINVPSEDAYGDIQLQEQFFAYWQLTEDTYFMVVVNGFNEELTNAYTQLLNDKKFQSSFELSSSIEN